LKNVKTNSHGEYLLINET